MITGAAIDIAGDCNWTAGTIASLGGPPVFTRFGGHLNVSSLGYQLSGRQAVSIGGVTWSGGFFTIRDGTTFDSQGAFTVQCDNLLGGGGAASTFINSGAFTKQITSGMTRVVSPTAFHNGPAGNVGVQTGTLRFEGGGQSEGQWLIGDDSTISFKSGAFDFVRGTDVTGNGLFWVEGAVVALADGHALSMQNMHVSGGGLRGARQLHFPPDAVDRRHPRRQRRDVARGP